MPMFKLVALWTLWCTFHSLLIKLPESSISPKLPRYLVTRYRIFYIFFSILSIIPVLLYQHSLPATILFSWPGTWRILQTGLFAYAILFFFLGLRAYDMLFFLGITQLQDGNNKQTNQKPLSLNTQGILSHVRHPWYSGAIALLWSNGPISNISLASTLTLSIYVIIGTCIEEARLKKEFGTSYVRYCSEVPMLFPWKIIRNKLRDI